MKVRVVGVGQLAAGDDGVGRRVIGELRSRALPEETLLLEVSEPSGLVEWLGEAVPTVVIDSVIADTEVGGAAGCVVELTPEQLATKPPLRVSSHGLGVSEAIELARTLYPVLAPLFIVAVTIDPPSRYQTELSPEVNAAVPVAADRVMSRLEKIYARNHVG